MGKKYDGILDCAQQTFKEEGIRGLYSGFFTAWSKIAPITCINLVTYEQLLKLPMFEIPK